MSNSISIASSKNAVNISGFALAWTLIMWTASYPGSWAIVSISTLLLCVFLVSLFTCVRTIGFSGLMGGTKALDMSMGVVWFIALFSMGFKPELKPLIGSVAQVILVVGLVYKAMTANRD